MRLVNEDAPVCVCNSAPWTRQRGNARSALCVRCRDGVRSALGFKKASRGQVLCWEMLKIVLESRRVISKNQGVRGVLGWTLWGSSTQQTVVLNTEECRWANSKNHLQINTFVLKSPPFGIITPPLPVVQKPASVLFILHMCTLAVRLLLSVTDTPWMYKGGDIFQHTFEC